MEKISVKRSWTKRNEAFGRSEIISASNPSSALDARQVTPVDHAAPKSEVLAHSSSVAPTSRLR